MKKKIFFTYEEDYLDLLERIASDVRNNKFNKNNYKKEGNKNEI